MDFANAFDTVPHIRLITKLAEYGVLGKRLDWIRQFLIGRKQRVGVAGSISEWTMVLSGVLQGSVLGPYTLSVLCQRYDRNDHIDDI